MLKHEFLRPCGSNVDISRCSCVPMVASGKAERRPPLTPPKLGGEENRLSAEYRVRSV